MVTGWMRGGVEEIRCIYRESGKWGMGCGHHEREVNERRLRGSEEKVTYFVLARLVFVFVDPDDS